MSTLWAQARQSFRGWDPRAPSGICSGSRVEKLEEEEKEEEEGEEGGGKRGRSGRGGGRGGEKQR